MAEALARHLGAGVIEPSSAGLYPALIIQPQTIEVLAERGVRLEPRQPRSIFLADLSGIDLLVNMSGGDVKNLLGDFSGRVVEWQIPDPIGESIQVYREVRDQIERKVGELIAEIRAAA